MSKKMRDLTKYPKKSVNCTDLIKGILSDLQSRLSPEDYSIVHELLYAVQARAAQETTASIITKAENISKSFERLAE